MPAQAARPVGSQLPLGKAQPGSQVSIPVAGSGHPASPSAGHWALRQACWTEQPCAGWPQMWGQGQKGAFRDGKSLTGRKELLVLPLTLLARNKRLLVLQLPVL